MKIIGTMAASVGLAAGGFVVGSMFGFMFCGVVILMALSESDKGKVKVKVHD